MQSVTSFVPSIVDLYQEQRAKIWIYTKDSIYISTISDALNKVEGSQMLFPSKLTLE